MSLRSCAAILAIAGGVSMVSAAQAAQVTNGFSVNGLSANGIVVNGFSVNGLSANGNDAQGHFPDAASSTTQLKAVILQDGSTIDLQ